MNKNLNLRRALAVALITARGLLMVLGFMPAKAPSQTGFRLAPLKLNFERLGLAERRRSAKQQNVRPNSNINVAPSTNAPTFGHPIIAGIGGTGFEESL